MKYGHTLTRVEVDGDHFGTDNPVWFTAPKDIRWVIQCAHIES